MTEAEKFLKRIKYFAKSTPYDLGLLRLITEEFKQTTEKHLKIKLAYYELKGAESKYFITSWWWGRKLVKQQETLLKFYEITGNMFGTTK
jgi:hypothetical protein